MHVVVTTKHRGVFFGELDKDNGAVVKLRQARNCVYWEASTHGFLGLAASGPGEGCRIGPAAPSLTVRGVTAVAECSQEAVEAWEAEPWK